MKSCKVIFTIIGILVVAAAVSAVIVTYREKIADFVLRLLDLGDRYVWTGVNKKLHPDEYEDYADV